MGKRPATSATLCAEIISTPTQGGHYLVDVLAGLLLAIVTIQILNFAKRERDG